MNYETSVDPASEEFEAAPSQRKKLILIALAIAAVLAIILYFMTHGEEESDFATSGSEQTPVITVIVPGKASVVSEITGTGSLAARREMPVGVVGEGGRVVSVAVEQGQWVRAGQVLAVIDRSVQTQQAESSAAQVEVAKADAKLAQANLDRALKLVDRGFISQADVDRLTATRDMAVAQVKVAEAQYRQLLATNARLNIVAPAAGLVLSRNVEPGQVVSSGTGTLFSIAKNGEMELLAQLGETELARLSVGVPAEVVPVGTDTSFSGQVWQIVPTIDELNRQGTARIALSYAPELRPGGFATATIRSGTVVAPMLPESAILSDDDGSYVFIVGEDNTAQRKPVETGLVTADGIVVASGLDGSEQIVLRAGGFLSNGEKIRPKVVKSGKQAD